jgi:ribonucleoside-diphosphate reductase alpha chain
VSNTINVRPHEWEDVADYIYNNRQWFAGISLLPQSGDLDYVQAPMVNVHTPREILHMYGDCCLLASGLIVDGLSVFDGDLWSACDSTLGLREVDEKDEDKQDWIRRVQQFADRYLDGDVRKCTYLMKEVNNWKLWLDLKREYVDIDYTTLIEDGDNTKPLLELSCAGNKCELM